MNEGQWARATREREKLVVCGGGVGGRASDVGVAAAILIDRVRHIKALSAARIPVEAGAHLGGSNCAYVSG